MRLGEARRSFLKKGAAVGGLVTFFPTEAAANVLHQQEVLREQNAIRNAMNIEITIGNRGVHAGLYQLTDSRYVDSLFPYDPKNPPPNSLYLLSLDHGLNGLSRPLIKVPGVGEVQADVQFRPLEGRRNDVDPMVAMMVTDQSQFGQQLRQAIREERIAPLQETSSAMTPVGMRFGMINSSGDVTTMNFVRFHDGDNALVMNNLTRPAVLGDSGRPVVRKDIQDPTKLTKISYGFAAGFPEANRQSQSVDELYVRRHF